MNEGNRPPDDPFVDPDDPEALAREQRRREREQRRREREAEAQEREQRQAEKDRKRRDAEEARERRESEQTREQSAAPQPPPAGREPRPRPSTRPALPDRARAAGSGIADRTRAARTRLDESLARRRERHTSPRAGEKAGAGSLVAGNGGRIAAVLVAALVLWFLVALFQPFHGEGSGKVLVQVPKGASVGDVADLLDDRGVVTSGALFEIRVTLGGKRSELYPGNFTMAKGMSYSDAIDVLSTAPEKRTITAVVPEGLSRAQIAPLAEDAGVRGSYLAASKRSKYINTARFGAPHPKDLEGFLFPATYELPARGTAADLVQLQLQAFRDRIPEVDMSYARSKNLTVYDVLTIASMIEREVQVPRERKLVAAVIYNRLRDGQPLGIDATIRFAVGNYLKPLTEPQLATPSPYNTRLNAGLPPGPIGNPGIAAIEAAAHPAKVGYRFYVVKPGSCGEHNFSTNEADFLRDQDAYQRALEAKGSSPTEC